MRPSTLALRDLDPGPPEPPLILQPAIDLYILRCEVEGKSGSTLGAYRYTLQRFARIAAEEQFPADLRLLTERHVYTYLGRSTSLSLETRHRYFREVRCFFNWLVETEQLEASPFRLVRNVRLPQRVVQPFTAADVKTLLGACSELTSIGVRDRAILLVLLDTGVRCSELVRFNYEDLDLTSCRIRVLHAKGNKQRVVPFASRCREALVAYLTRRRVSGGPLFLAAFGSGSLREGTALQPNGLKQLLRRLSRATHIAKVHPHRFRHTFATWAIEADARELDVQFLLGHSSPDMVRRYASSYNCEQAARRHSAFSPANCLD